MKDPVVLLANGQEPTDSKIIDFLKSAGTIICVDGGYEFAKKFNIKPNIVIGDFDSTDLNKIDDEIRVIRAEDQNKTDLEKAIEFCISENLDKIILIAANGAKDDHNLANILLMDHFFPKICIEIMTNHFLIEIFKGKKTFDLPIGSQISLISLESNNFVTSKGLRFELNNEKLRSPSNGISNVVVQELIEITSEKPLIIFKQ